MSGIYSVPLYMWPTVWLSAVCCTSKCPATPFCFSHAGVANNLDAANQGVSNSQIIEDTQQLTDYRGHCQTLFLPWDYLVEIILK